MLLSASILLLSAASPNLATDIVPIRLATRPDVVDIRMEPYDWTLQRSRVQAGVRVADSTANCSTATIETNRNGKTDQVHDCGFD